MFKDRDWGPRTRLEVQGDDQVESPSTVPVQVSEDGDLLLNIYLTTQMRRGYRFLVVTLRPSPFTPEVDTVLLVRRRVCLKEIQHID